MSNVRSAKRTTKDDLEQRISSEAKKRIALEAKLKKVEAKLAEKGLHIEPDEPEVVEPKSDPIPDGCEIDGDKLMAYGIQIGFYVDGRATIWSEHEIQENQLREKMDTDHAQDVEAHDAECLRRIREREGPRPVRSWPEGKPHTRKEVLAERARFPFRLTAEMQMQGINCPNFGGRPSYDEWRDEAGLRARLAIVRGEVVDEYAGRDAEGNELPNGHYRDPFGLIRGKDGRVVPRARLNELMGKRPPMADPAEVSTQSEDRNRLPDAVRNAGDEPERAKLNDPARDGVRDMRELNTRLRREAAEYHSKIALAQGIGKAFGGR